MDLVFAIDSTTAICIKDAVIDSVSLTSEEVKESSPLRFGGAAPQIKGAIKGVGTMTVFSTVRPASIRLSISGVSIEVHPLNTVDETQVITIHPNGMSVVVSEVQDFSWETAGSTLTFAYVNIGLRVQSIHPTYEAACAAVMKKRIEGDD